MQPHVEAHDGEHSHPQGEVVGVSLLGEQMSEVNGVPAAEKGTWLGKDFEMGTGETEQMY